MSDVTVSKPARRTQRERREATMARLVDATIEALVELGYARTTLQEICKRAEVSTGALFRHFGGRRELMVAAADEVARRQIARFDEEFAALPADRRVLTVALELMREHSRAPINAVWFELLVAARTDAELRAELQPAARRFSQAISGQAGGLAWNDLPELPRRTFDNLVTSLIHMFDGESITRVVHPLPELERDRIPLLLGLIGVTDTVDG